MSNLIMAGYLLFLNGRFGIYGLSAAMLIGWFAQAAVQIPSAVKRGFRLRLTAPLNTPEIRRAARNTVPILIATWTTPLCAIINTRLASGIENGRAIIALGYANRLYLSIVGLFSFVATNLLFPTFARAAAAGDAEESDRLTRTSLRTLIFIIAPIAAGVAALAAPFVGLIYERGVFTAEDTALTAAALSMYALGMLFSACGEVLTKAFFAAEKTKLPMIASLCSMLFNVAAVYGMRALLGERFGVGVVALMTALSAGVGMGINLVFAYRHGMISFRVSGWLDAGKSVLSALLTGAAVWFIYGRCGAAGLGRLPAFALSVPAGAAVYGAAALLLGSGEMRGLIRAARDRLRGRKKREEGGGSHD